MNENILKQALLETADDMILKQYSDCENIDFIPTNSFKKKIDKLCKNYDKVSFKLTYTRARKAIVIFVAVLVIMLSSLTVGAVRDAIANFFVTHFSNHADVTYKEPSTKSNQYPKTIEKVYELKTVPKGFSLADCSITDASADTIYFSDDGQIVLQQVVKEKFNESIDNENSIITYETINGQDYIVQTSKISKDISFIWDNGEYVFSLTASLDKDSIIDICENLRIKK